ncbi:zinc finger protein 33A-like isoform X1 [Anopheles stephensi]|uniref:zinc finger protein 33A-like isoform X1 n=1 Tax=Anopheles stephensi TaxID=30069 RepID=UPI0016588D3B|nr:zinc finger protein 33A-like isoform X1 [Anopheles stephensi]
MEPQKVHNICRFCLCQDENLLRPIRGTLSSSMTLEDVERFTGLRINAKESTSYAMCAGCVQTLESCAKFHQSCLNNNAQFQELLALPLLVKTKCIPKHSVEPLAEDPLILHFTIEDDDDEDVIIHNDHNYSANPDDEQHQRMCTQELETYSANYITIGEHSVSDNDEQECHFEHWGRKAKTNTTHKTLASPSQEEEPMEREISTKRTKLSHHPQKLCSECGKLVTNIPYHIQLHKNEKKHACPHCSVKMRCKGNLVRHIKSVHLKLVYKTCKICDKKCYNRNVYLSHMISNHDIGQKIQCKYCPRLFSNKYSVDSHTARIHSNVRRFECDICGKLFKLRRMLKIHMRVHSADQPYQCSKCPKRFKSRNAKKVHEITHDGTIFECELCDKTYRYKSLLSMHIRKQHPKETVQDEEDSEGTRMSNK